MDDPEMIDLLRRIRETLDTWFNSDAPEAEFELYTQTRELIEEIDARLNQE